MSYRPYINEVRSPYAAKPLIKSSTEKPRITKKLTRRRPRLEKKCIEYLRRAGSTSAALKLADKDGFMPETYVWISAVDAWMSKLIGVVATDAPRLKKK